MFSSFDLFVRAHVGGVDDIVIFKSVRSENNSFLDIVKQRVYGAKGSVECGHCGGR